MPLSWLAEKLFGRSKEYSRDNLEQIWAEWDVRRMAAKEVGEPFEEAAPERPKSGRRRWRKGRTSAVDVGAAGTAGVFFAAPPVDHHHGGFDGGFHGGGGDAGGVF